MRILFLLVILFGCARQRENQALQQQAQPVNEPSLVVLGTVQDAGSPHIGCKKECCQKFFQNPDPTRKVVSLGIADPGSNQRWIIEATPDLPSQLKLLNNYAEVENSAPSGILLTHAHIGHYAGLMYLGREGMNAKEVPVYALPRMKNFLEQNGPWSQLAALKNIVLADISAEEKIQLSATVSVTPFLVPHRDEFSETAGYLIEGPRKKALFIPDIDKWEKWNTSITDLIRKADYAFLDATFYDADEIQGRDIREIPHPFVVESIALFDELPEAEKKKIYFIHFNHTNPLLNSAGEEYKEVEAQGYAIAKLGLVFPL